MNDESSRLVPLGRTRDYAVREGMPDVRGWDVVGGDGTVLGRVAELMVDPAAGRVRYLEIELEEADRRRVHVPIGLARLDAERDAVLVPTITTATMRTLTTVHGDPHGATLTREYEVRVRRSLAGEVPADAATASDADDRFYEHEHYDEREFAGPRRGRRRADHESDDDEDFAYLAGVGGAMTERDAHPHIVGEVGAGQIAVPLMEDETRRKIAPEDGTAPAQEGPPPDRLG